MQQPSSAMSDDNADEAAPDAAASNSVPAASPRAGRSIFLIGSIFGVVSGVGLLALALFLPRFGAINTALLYFALVWGLPVSVQWLFYLVCGILVSRRTGTISSAVFASFWANLWYLLCSLAAYFLQASNIEYHFALSSGNTLTLYFLVGGFCFVLSLGMGAGFGALGGLIGRALHAPKTGAATPA